jgi:hypothetical protein
MLLRGTVFDAHGAVVRDFHLPGRPGVLACSRAGILAVLEVPPDMHPPDRDGRSPHFRASLKIVDREGQTLHQVGRVAAMESRPLGKVTSIAVTRDFLYVGTKDSAFVDVYRNSGSPFGTVAVKVDRRRPLRLHYERAVDALVQPLADRGYREQMKQLLLDIPMPTNLPPYSALLADPDGMLWVVTSIAGDSSTTLRGIGSDGHVLMDLEIPRDLRVFEVGRDYVLGAYEAPSGDPHVALFRFRRSN